MEESSTTKKQCSKVINIEKMKDVYAEYVIDEDKDDLESVDEKAVDLCVAEVNVADVKVAGENVVVKKSPDVKVADANAAEKTRLV